MVAVGADFLVGVIRNKDLATCGVRLDAKCQVNGTPNHTVFSAFFRANIADNDPSGVNANAHFLFWKASFGHGGIDLGHGLLHCDRTGHGPLWMVVIVLKLQGPKNH